MKLKILMEGQYVISAIMEGDKCPVEDFLSADNHNYQSNCNGLLDMIERISKEGLQQFSSQQSHFINNEPKIYELIRGKLRLIYFHGKRNNIVVCTEVIVKKGQKANKNMVSKASKAYDEYFKAFENKTLIEIR